MENRKKETIGIILRALVAMILFVVAIVNYDKLSGLDVDKNAIQRIECGKRFVTDIEIKAFTKVFNVTFEELSK